MWRATFLVGFFDIFKVQNIIGKSVVIHQSSDGYRAQPAGASGKKLGCGVIRQFGYF
ncbi:MAG: superoxide dismutase family protein [Thermincola sp.]|nr:superoxide dismutase family protein [Thermincola sp.]MDT3704444.1 superoxide dismutase family protein [Thermincola sp.]